MELFEQTYKKKIEKGSDNFLREISKIESEYKVHENYLKDFEENQLNWSMRAILVDWMFEVADDFKLKRDTCYDAVNILDRFLQTKSNIIQKKNLQGIAITVLHIAAKKEVLSFLSLWFENNLLLGNSPS